MDRSPPPRWVHGLFALYCALALAAITWPGYAWAGQKVKPFVLGLPFSLAWIVGWVVLTFAVLVLYERAAHRGR